MANVTFTGTEQQALLISDVVMYAIEHELNFAAKLDGTDDLAIALAEGTTEFDDFDAQVLTESAVAAMNNFANSRDLQKAFRVNKLQLRIAIACFKF